MPSNSGLPGSAPSAHYARFSDGFSAAARDGFVAFGVSGIEISLQNPSERLLWPYASLRSGEPVRSHPVDVLLSSASMPGATLFVPGPAFATKLKDHAPHLTAKAERWRHARPWLFLTAAVCSFLTLIYVAGWSPIRSIAQVLPDSWRQRLGDEARASSGPRAFSINSRVITICPPGTANAFMSDQS